MVFREKPSNFHYFAYGANMNAAQIGARCVRPVVVGIAKLPHYCLAFFGYSKIWDGAVETVVPAVNQEVWGVIYELTVADWERLDACQDVRLDGTGTYFHFPDRVTDTAGNTHHVLLYKKDILKEQQLPSRQYLDFIIQGALARGLPADYIEALRRLESRPSTYEVPRSGKSGPELRLESSCARCEDLLAEHGGDGQRSLDGFSQGAVSCDKEDL